MLTPVPGAPRDPSPTSPQPQAARPAVPAVAPALTWARLRRLISFYRPHVPVLLADLACAVVVSGTALLLPLCASLVARRLTDAPEAADALGSTALLGGAMLALLALQAVATFVVDFHGHMMGARIEAAVRRELFEHAQRLGFGFHDRNRTGQLMSRITNDSFDLGELFHHGPEDLVIAVMKSVGVVAVLAILDGPLTLLILLVVPVAVLHALRHGARVNQATRAGAERIGAINERVEDALAGVRVVQSFGREALEDNRFEAENQRFLQSRWAVYRSEAHFDVGLTGFPQLLSVLVIVAGAWRVAEGMMDVADLLAFLLGVAVLSDPTRRAANLVRLWQQGFTGFVRMVEVLEVEPEVQDRSEAASSCTAGHSNAEIVSCYPPYAHGPRG